MHELSRQRLMSLSQSIRIRNHLIKLTGGNLEHIQHITNVRLLYYDEGGRYFLHVLKGLARFVGE